MVVNKRKKVTKYRAHTTHGGGHRKKRRGAGSRGGRGRAGTGKRASHKKEVLGRKSGKKNQKSLKDVKTINVNYFTLDRLEKLLKEEKISFESEMYKIDLKKLGYDKLLGGGKTNLKLSIVAKQWSTKAEEKIKSAGGELNNA